MPIIEITKDSVRQRCTGCERERDVRVADLSSTTEPIQLENGILALPPCPCGSSEFLVRAPNGEPPHPASGSFGHRHRMMVDALVDTVKTKSGSQPPPVDLAEAVQTALGAAVVAEWFAGGLKVDLPEAPTGDIGETGGSTR